MLIRGSVGKFWHNLKEHGVVITAVIPAVIAALVSLVGFGFSYSNSQKTLDQARQLTEYRNDIDLLGRFADFHFASRESRRDTFSLYIVDQMKDPGYRKGLRVLVFRDVMASNFRKPAPVTPFDKDDDDWRIAGDALSNLRKAWQDQHERRTFGDWWCEEKREALKRWPDHEERLRELYRYLDDQHLDDRHFRTVDRDKLSKLLSCDLPKK